MTDQPSPSEFAPLYSRRERWRILLKIALILLPLAAIFFVWVLPWLNTFLLTAHCQNLLGFNGLTFVMTLMLALPPLLLVLFLFVTEGPKSWQVYQLKQTPLPGEKVMNPTRYRYGNRALLRPIGFLMALLLLLLIVIWSVWMVSQFSERIKEKSENCPQMTSLILVNSTFDTV